MKWQSHLGGVFGPEPDHWQWYQSVPQLLGHEPPNQGPTQDWEFQLVDLQARGLLDKPAYKNLTDEIVVTAEKAVAGGQVAHATTTSPKFPTHKKAIGADGTLVDEEIYDPNKGMTQAPNSIGEAPGNKKHIDQIFPSAANNLRRSQHSAEHMQPLQGEPLPEMSATPPTSTREAPNASQQGNGMNGSMSLAQLQSNIAHARADIEAAQPGYVERMQIEAVRSSTQLRISLDASGGLAGSVSLDLPEGKTLDELTQEEKIKLFGTVGESAGGAKSIGGILSTPAGKANAALLAVDLGMAIVQADAGTDGFGRRFSRELFALGAGSLTTAVALSIAAGIIGAPLTVTLGAAIVLGAMGYMVSDLAGRAHDRYMDTLAPSSAPQANQ